MVVCVSDLKMLGVKNTPEQGLTEVSSVQTRHTHRPTFRSPFIVSVEPDLLDNTFSRLLRANGNDDLKFFFYFCSGDF